MKRSLMILLCLCLLPGLGLAQDRSTLDEAEAQRALLLAHKQRLEAALDDQARRIDRLKGQTTGMRRDLQLEAALRQGQDLAQKLASLQRRLHEATASVLRHLDQRLKDTPPSPVREELERRRERLTQQHASLKAALSAPSMAEPLDSPEDLEEKADLLDDSAEKVARRLAEVDQRLSRLRQRLRLARHGRAMDDAPFDETSTGGMAPARASSSRSDDAAARATAPEAKQSGEHGASYNADPKGGVSPSGSASPAPGPDKSDLDAHVPTTPGATSDGASARAPGLKSGNPAWTLLDPELQRELGRPIQDSGSLEGRIASLEQARQRLRRAAADLALRSNTLRKRAAVISNKR